MSAELDRAFEAARDGLRESYQGKPWVPTINAYSPMCSVVIVMPFTNNREKRLFVAMAREQMKQMGATHFVATVEAWTSPAPEDHDIHNHKGLMPSEHPDREEIIFIHGEDNGGDVRSGCFKLICKPKTAKCAKLGEWIEKDETGVVQTTLFTNMFGRMLQ